MAKKSFDTIVIKIGSSSLTNPSGKLDHTNLERIVTETAELFNNLIIPSGNFIISTPNQDNIRKEYLS